MGRLKLLAVIALLAFALSLVPSTARADSPEWTLTRIRKPSEVRGLVLGLGGSEQQANRVEQLVQEKLAQLSRQGTRQGSRVDPMYVQQQDTVPLACVDGQGAAAIFATGPGDVSTYFLGVPPELYSLVNDVCDDPLSCMYFHSAAGRPGVRYTGHSVIAWNSWINHWSWWCT